RMNVQKISPCLWFDGQAEEAAQFYTSIFNNSEIVRISYYSKTFTDVSGMAEGSARTVEFRMDGQSFTALNGGPYFQFNEAISFVVYCDNQEELDYYWEKLAEGGDESAQQCGWLKDKFGVSWQIVPANIFELLCSTDPEKSERVAEAIFTMKK